MPLAASAAASTRSTASDSCDNSAAAERSEPQSAASRLFSCECAKSSNRWANAIASPAFALRAVRPLQPAGVNDAKGAVDLPRPSGPKNRSLHESPAGDGSAFPPATRFMEKPGGSHSNQSLEKIGTSIVAKGAVNGTLPKLAAAGPRYSMASVTPLSSGGTSTRACRPPSGR